MRSMGRRRRTSFMQSRWQRYVCWSRRLNRCMKSWDSRLGNSKDLKKIWAWNSAYTSRRSRHIGHISMQWVYTRSSDTKMEGKRIGTSLGIRLMHGSARQSLSTKIFQGLTMIKGGKPSHSLSIWSSRSSFWEPIATWNIKSNWPQRS